jgi:hypothetical protein
MDVPSPTSEMCHETPGSEDDFAHPKHQPQKPFPLLSLPKDLRLMVYEAIPVAARSATIELVNEPMTMSVIGGPVALLATCRQIRAEALPLLQPKLNALKPTKLLIQLPCDGCPSYRHLTKCRAEVEPLLEHLYKCAWNATCKKTHDQLPLPNAFEELARTDPAFFRAFLRQSGIFLRKESAKILSGIACVDGANLIGDFPSVKFKAEFWFPCRLIEDDNAPSVGDDFYFTRA